jgi:hypothetical protein
VLDAVEATVELPPESVESPDHFRNAPVRGVLPLREPVQALRDGIQALLDSGLPVEQALQRGCHASDSNLDLGHGAPSVTIVRTLAAQRRSGGSQLQKMFYGRNGPARTPVSRLSVSWRVLYRA